MKGLTARFKIFACVTGAFAALGFSISWILLAYSSIVYAHQNVPELFRYIAPPITLPGFSSSIGGWVAAGLLTAVLYAVPGLIVGLLVAVLLPSRSRSIMTPRRVGGHEVMRRMRTLKHLVISILGGIGTCIAISCLDWLPYSWVRDMISDTLKLPGGFLAHLFYPAGIHTIGGAPGWATIAIGANLVFYVLLWFFIILIIIAMRKTGN